MKYLLILTLIMSVGCATLKPAQLPSVAKANDTLVVKDLRGEKQSKTEMLSYLVTSCLYGIQRLGDEWSTPGRVQYLSDVVSAELPDKKELVITDFVTYMNMQHMLREGNIYRGPLFTLLECDENTDQFTNYTFEENPQRMSIVIGTLKGTLDGKAFSERVISFPFCPEGQAECSGWDAQANSVKNIVVELTKRMIEKNK